MILFLKCMELLVAHPVSNVIKSDVGLTMFVKVTIGDVYHSIDI